MKNKIAELLKRYFLWASHAPLAAGVLCGTVPATTIVCGWAIALIVMGRLDGLDSSADPWFFGSIFTFLGLGVMLGIVNNHVCRRFISYCPGPGAFFACKVWTVNVGGREERARTRLLAPPANPLWFWRRQEGWEIRWFGLPDWPKQLVTHKVELDLGPFDILLEVAIGEEFDLKEIYSEIVRSSDYEDFNAWLRPRFLAAADTPAVRRVLARVDDHEPPGSLLVDLEEALLEVKREKRFSGRPLSNLGGINAIVSASTEVYYE